MATTTTSNQNTLPDLLTPALRVQQDLNEMREVMEPIDKTIGTEILDFISEVQCVSILRPFSCSKISNFILIQKYDTLKVESRVFAMTLKTHIQGMSHTRILVLMFPMVLPT
jgi:hypothetical protein